MAPDAATCALCGSSHNATVFEQATWSVVTCRACGLVFVHPIPDRTSLQDLYPEDYYAHVEGPGRRRLGRELKRLVANEFYGLRLDHRFAAWPRPVRRALAWPLRDRMRIPPPRDVERRVLDIGCGNGRYLCWLREIGWECYGNETDPRAVAVARKAGLSVFHGDLADANYADEFFDVVNVSSVLDHTADPMGNVRHAYRVLRRGGWIVAHSPNFDGLQSWFFGTRWIDFIPPEHLYFFTPRTFRSVFERAGFVVERIWTASPTNSLSHTLMYRTWARPLFLYARDHWGLEPEWWPLVKLAFWPAARMQDVLGRGEAVYLRARKPAGGGSREDPATV